MIIYYPEKKYDLDVTHFRAKLLDREIILERKYIFMIIVDGWVLISDGFYLYVRKDVFDTSFYHAYVADRSNENLLIGIVENMGLPSSYDVETALTAVVGSKIYAYLGRFISPILSDQKFDLVEGRVDHCPITIDRQDYTEHIIREYRRFRAKFSVNIVLTEEYDLRHSVSTKKIENYEMILVRK